MTKDEILYEINKQMIIEAGFDPFFFTFSEFIKKQNEDEEKKEMVSWAKRAMDLYAKQQAIAFAIDYTKRVLTWIDVNHMKPEDVANDRMEERYAHFFAEQQNKQ